MSHYPDDFRGVLPDEHADPHIDDEDTSHEIKFADEHEAELVILREMTAAFLTAIEARFVYGKAAPAMAALAKDLVAGLRDALHDSDVTLYWDALERLSDYDRAPRFYDGGER